MKIKADGGKFHVPVSSEAGQSHAWVEMSELTESAIIATPCGACGAALEIEIDMDNHWLGMRCSSHRQPWLRRARLLSV